MGVRGLLTYCNPIKHPVTREIVNLRIGLDGFSLLFLFREEREAFEAYLRKLKASAREVCLVMDKRAAKEKHEVVKERKEQRKEAKAEANTLSSFTQTPEFIELEPEQRVILEKLLAQKERAAWCLYPDYLKWFINLLKTIEIPLIWAPEEADTILIQGKYDIIISSDSDLLILGAKNLWIPIKIHTSIQHKEICGDEFLQYLGLQGEQLFELAYMAGCDVQPKSLMSLHEAVSRLRFYGTIHEIHRKYPEIICSENIQEYFRLRRDVWTY